MKQSLAKSSIYLSISSGIFMLSAYLINIFLGRYLGPVDYGTYGIVISLMTVVNLIQTAGLPQAVSKYIAQNEERAESILKSGLTIQIVSTILITLGYFLLAKPIAYLLHDTTIIPFLQLSSLIFPFYGIYALYTGYYNGLHDFKRQTVITIIYSLAKTLFVIPFAIFFSLSGAIAGFIIAPFFSLLTGFKLPKFDIPIFPYKKLLLFSLPLIVFAFLSTLLQSVDLYFIKSLLASDNAPGFYTANQNIARIPFFTFSALALVLFPSISKKVSENKLESIQNLIQKSLRIMLVLLIPGICITAATSGQLLELIYSKVYLPGASSLEILLFGSGFFTIFIILANILNGASLPKKSVLSTGIALLSTIIFCILMVPKLGLNGAALATTIGCFIAMIISSYFVYKQFKTLVSIKTVIKILIPSLIIYFLAKVITLPLLLLPLLYLILFAVYLGLLFLLKEITKDDLMLIKSLLPETIRRKINR